jgi:hypothetical protein
MQCFFHVDKSGFMSGLVNHAVSAAMRTIMKVFGAEVWILHFCTSRKTDMSAGFK